MDPMQIAMLIAIGIVGGVWNAIAGGATLFTFPALMAVGLPPLVANATNYLGLLPANLAALPAYREELRGLGKRLLTLLIVSGAGAILGALLLLASDAALFTALIPFLILLATLLFAFGDKLRQLLLSLAGEASGARMIFVALFLFSIYGGYFGAGLGIILLAVAQMLGLTDFHVANTIKNLLAASFTILSILVFGIGGLIAWPEAAALMAGSSVGGYFGGRIAKNVNQTLLRLVVIAFGFLLAGVYLVRTFA